jgi:hypothetical protein
MGFLRDVLTPVDETLADSADTFPEEAETHPESRLVSDSDTGEEPESKSTKYERPEGLPANFKSVHALAKSYRHGQNKIREQGEEITRLRQQATSFDAGAMRQVLAEHRRLYFAGQREEANWQLGWENRIAAIETAVAVFRATQEPEEDQSE